VTKKTNFFFKFFGNFLANFLENEKISLYKFTSGEKSLPGVPPLSASAKPRIGEVSSVVKVSKFQLGSASGFKFFVAVNLGPLLPLVF
jgi:hypothetical protein